MRRRLTRLTVLLPIVVLLVVGISSPALAGDPTAASATGRAWLVAAATTASASWGDDAALIAAAAAVLLSVTVGGSAVAATRGMTRRDRGIGPRETLTEVRESLTTCLVFLDSLTLARSGSEVTPGPVERTTAITALNRLEMQLISLQDHEIKSKGQQFRRGFIDLLSSSKPAGEHVEEVRQMGLSLAEALARPGPRRALPAA